MIRLLITSDQHRADCLGVAGRAVRTPHLDLMAAQGSRFEACITPNVVCMPARASMLTGLLPLTHGTHDNGIDLDEDTGARGFAGTLARAGHATAFIGKAHFSSNHSARPTGRCENVLSSNRFPDDWFGPYMGFDHVELMQLGHHYWLPERPPGGLHYERWYHGDGLGDLKDRLYRERLPPQTHAAQTHHSALPVAWHNSTWVGDRGVAYLRERARERTRGTEAAPFCAWLSFADPHHPFDAPAPWCWMHRPEDVDLPPARTRDLDERPWWHRAALERPPQGGTPEARRVREEYSRMPMQTDAQLRELIASYYGMISLVDHQVGRLLAVLHETGLVDDTLVIFTSDHGDWLGDHGLVLKGPMFYEGLLRVPLIVRGPGVPASRVVADPVSTIDLAATLGDFAGVPMPDARHSRSLRPLIEGHEDPAGRRDHALTEWRLGPQRCGVALDLRAVRTRDAKLTLELGSDADAELGTDARRRLALACYFGLVNFLDEQVGHVLQALHDSGQAGSTLVVFASDHGDNQGVRGLWNKSMLYRESTEVPLILAGPGVPAGQVRSTLASLVDIAPTVLDAAGLPPPADGPGRSLRPLAREPDDPSRVGFSEYHAVGSPSAAYLVRQGRWAYHHYVGFAPELFDLASDPGQTRDLGTDPDHAPVCAHLETLLRRMLDPEATDRRAKADQAALVARHGGREAALALGPEGATPVPAATDP